MPPQRARRGARSADRQAVAAPELKLSPGAIGKLVSTKEFHCVRARDYAAFYKVLTQLK